MESFICPRCGKEFNKKKIVLKHLAKADEKLCPDKYICAGFECFPEDDQTLAVACYDELMEEFEEKHKAKWLLNRHQKVMEEIVKEYIEDNDLPFTLKLLRIKANEK